MEANTAYLVFGAAGAVLAILLLVFLHGIWAHRLLPLWQRWRYRGVNLSGGWKGLGNGCLPASGEWTVVGLSLEQQTSELRGLLWIRRCSASRSSELRVPLCGSIREGHVTLTASSNGECPAAHAVALLEIDTRGSCLIGQLLYRDPDTESIEGFQLSIYRAASMVLPSLRPLPGVHAAAGGAA